MSMCVYVYVCAIVCICFCFSVDEIAEDTESFKSSTCSAAPLATSMRMAIANAGLASHELALKLDSLLSLPQMCSATLHLIAPHAISIGAADDQASS